MTSPLQNIITLVSESQTDGIVIAVAITLMFFMIQAAKWIRNAEFNYDPSEKYRHFDSGESYLDTGMDIDDYHSKVYQWDGIDRDGRYHEYESQLEYNGYCKECGQEKEFSYCANCDL